MKSNEQKAQKISVLIKSAALILLYPMQADKYTSYKTIVIKRKSSMSFANSYAFPGGACDPQDMQMAGSADFSIYSKICAVRQFLEETGILIYPSSSQKQIYAHKFLAKSIPNMAKEIGSIWKSNLGLLQPIFRALTPQSIKGKRFDCLFYLCRINPQVKLINISLLKHNLNLKEQQNQSVSLKFENQTQNQFTNLHKTAFIYDKNESDDLLFEAPEMFIQLKNSSTIFMFPAQIIIMEALNNLCKLKQYRQQLLQYSINPSQNYFNSIEPILSQIEIANPTLMILFGDKKYNYKEVLAKQRQSASKQQVRKHFNAKVSQYVLKQNANRNIQLKHRIKMNSDYCIQDRKCILKYLERIEQYDKK